MSGGPQPVAPGVWRVVSGFVNFYVVEDAGRLALVDAGCRGDRARLENALAALGFSVADVADLVLTHSHVDHMGLAAWLQRSAGARVWAHPEAVERLRRPTASMETERGTAPYLLHAVTWRTLGWLATHGGFAGEAVDAIATVADGDVLADVAGRPRALHTPGHCDGHIALVLDERRVAFSGDALCTANPYVPRTGPQVLSRGVNKDTDLALASLARLEDLDIAVIAPGHGAPWRGSAAEAVRLARAAGPS